MSSSILLPKNHFLFSFLSESGLPYLIGCTGNRGELLAHWLGPFISWRNAVTTPICSALILDLPWPLYPFPPSQTFYPVYSACVAKLPRVWYELRSGNALPLQHQPLNQWVIPVRPLHGWHLYFSAHCFSFLCTLPGYQKQNGGLDIIEAFFPFSSCKLQKHGRRSFCDCSVLDSLRLILLFSFDSPEFSVRAFWSFFFRCEVVFWTFSLFLVAFPNCR